jgi:hypothetical protein
MFLGIFPCIQSDGHPQEDLAKSGYKPDTTVQIGNHLCRISGCILKSKYRNLAFSYINFPF